MGINYYDGQDFREVAALEQADGQAAPAYRYDGSQWVKIYPARLESVVYQWRAEDYSSGSDWNDTVVSETMSIVGSPTETTLSDGAQAVGFDGVDDAGLAAIFSDVSISTGAWEMAFQTTETDVVLPFGAQEGDRSGYVTLNQDEAANTDEGNIRFVLADNDDNSLTAAPSTNPGLNDGSRHNITWSFDAPNNDVQIFIDGSSVSVAYDDQQSPDNFGTVGSEDYGFGARDGGGGTLGNYAEVDVGVWRFHDEQISEQTIGN
jgi:hypothetical protein